VLHERHAGPQSARVEQPAGLPLNARDSPAGKETVMRALTKWSPRARRMGLEPSGLGTRWDAFREMEKEMAMLWDRMDRAFGRWPMESTGEDLTTTTWSPNVDITEDDREYQIKAELPEVKKEEIKVLVRDGMLSISGERKSEKEEKGRKYHRIERAYGSFERSFRLPSDADATKITSDFKDGVLNVHLPKVPGTKPKAIEVKVA
jgi:HSP20 family protein